MSNLTTAELLDVKRADELGVGDRIAAGFLPHHQPAHVTYVQPYVGYDLRPWVLVVHQADGMPPDVDFWIAHGQVPVDGAEDPDHGRTTAVADAKPDTLGLSLGSAARRNGGAW